MLPLEKSLSYEMNEMRNELMLLETFITGLGLDDSLAGKILQKAVYESIETGRPTIDILHDYCDRLRMGHTVWR